jgi:tRNA pseudouridine55 synthase
LATPGLLLVDKPEGITSHDVVSKVRKLVGTRKVGHAGTLDPMATGLLVLGIESGTKLLTFIVGKDKTYEATIRLGSSTVTDDREGDVLTTATPDQISAITEEAILSGISKLSGVIQQKPSAVSAIKVDGERAYARVRAGEEVDLPSREVTVSRFEVLGEIRFTNEYIELDVVVDCSSGTYIRALARDLGKDLGVGGHLTALRRTRIGEFDLSNAYDFSDRSPVNIIELADAAKTSLPYIEISTQDEIDIRFGKRISGNVAEPTAALCSGELVAVVEPASSISLKSLVVFGKGDSNV